LLFVQLRSAEAEPLAREATAICRKTFPPGHPEIASSLNALATVLYARDKFDEAEEMWREAIAIARAALPANHPDIAVFLQNLAAMYAKQGKNDQAVKYYRESIPVFEQAFGKDAWQTGVSRVCLGMNLVELNRHAEAETTMLDALRAFESSGATVSRDRCIVQLVNLYQVWHQAEPGKGYDAKAKPWQARLAATRPATQP
jgi:tetratricopeptide (TPR) repeat protein